MSEREVEKYAEDRAQTPVVFPLTEPDEDTVKAMERAWSRQNLTRYLQRWTGSPIPEPPAAFWAFPWRACDVGCGFGKYIIEQSKLFPERAWLGIDKGNLRGGTMLARTHQAGQTNLFGLHANAIPVLAQMPEAQLDQISILYPNPWWPNKHRGKRWSYHPLTPKLIRLLKPGGRLLLASNEGFYLNEWHYALRNHPAVKDEIELEYAGPIRSETGRTHFEVKYLQNGVPCGEIGFRRKASA